MIDLFTKLFIYLKDKTVKPSSIKLRRYVDLLKWGFTEIRYSLQALTVPALVQQRVPVALQLRTAEGRALSPESSSDDWR